MPGRKCRLRAGSAGARRSCRPLALLGWPAARPERGCQWWLLRPWAAAAGGALSGCCGRLAWALPARRP